jgi:hypothetical protein
MADKEPRQPTHRAYSVIRREGQDDYWLNIGLVFPHKDNGGFNIMLQAFPLRALLRARARTRCSVRGSARHGLYRRAVTVDWGAARIIETPG